MLSQKVTPLILLHIFHLAAILHGRKFTQLFAIHILSYVPVLVHISIFASNDTHYPVFLTAHFSLLL